MELDVRECCGDIDPFIAAGPVGGMTGFGVPFRATLCCTGVTFCGRARDVTGSGTMAGWLAGVEVPEDEVALPAAYYESVI